MSTRVWTGLCLTLLSCTPLPPVGGAIEDAAVADAAPADTGAPTDGGPVEDAATKDGGSPPVYGLPSAAATTCEHLSTGPITGVSVLALNDDAVFWIGGSCVGEDPFTYVHKTPRAAVKQGLPLCAGATEARLDGRPSNIGVNATTPPIGAPRLLAVHAGTVLVATATRIVVWDGATALPTSNFVFGDGLGNGGAMSERTRAAIRTRPSNSPTPSIASIDANGNIAVHDWTTGRPGRSANGQAIAFEGETAFTSVARNGEIAIENLSNGGRLATFPDGTSVDELLVLTSSTIMVRSGSTVTYATTNLNTALAPRFEAIANVLNDGNQFVGFGGENTSTIYRGAIVSGTPMLNTVATTLPVHAIAAQKQGSGADIAILGTCRSMPFVAMQTF